MIALESLSLYTRSLWAFLMLNVRDIGVWHMNMGHTLCQELL